jgi:glycosyltransferase involved in cell wall biosynthesis
MTNPHPMPPEFVEGPLVTIAIPTFNRASWLGECIGAALAQSYQNFEVLVSDNASTDETPVVLGQISDPRLRVVRQEENIGLIRNWNACLAEATGDYIVFVSDDDLVAPFLLERCVTLIKEEPKLPIVICLTDTSILDEGHTLQATPSQKFGTGVWDGGDLLLEYLRRRISPTMCGVLFRTEKLRAIGGFPLDMPHAEDASCWVQVLMASKAGFINESCATYSIHSTAETARLSDDAIVGDFRKLIDMILERADPCIEDRQKRREIKRAARLFLALCPVYLGIARAGDAKQSGALPIVWKWRRELAGAGIGNTFTLARALAHLLLPQPITRLIQRGGRALRRPTSRPQGLQERTSVQN